MEDLNVVVTEQLFFGEGTLNLCQKRLFVLLVHTGCCRPIGIVYGECDFQIGFRHDRPSFVFSARLLPTKFIDESSIGEQASVLKGQKRVRMVDLGSRFSEGPWCHLGVLLKILHEVGWILEAQAIANFLNAQTRMHQEPFGFQDDTFLNQLRGCFVGKLVC